MKLYYYNGCKVTQAEYLECYKRQYRRGIDPAPSRFMRLSHYCTSNGYAFRQVTV